MQLKTHLKINHTLNGDILELKEGYAKVVLKTTDIMRADEEGLVHGGFCFCAADFTAMAAVNDPFVVLAKSESKFLAPVCVGEEIFFEGYVTVREKQKYTVEVLGSIGEKAVFSGIFHAVVLQKHVLAL